MFGGFQWTFLVTWGKTWEKIWLLSFRPRWKPDSREEEVFGIHSHPRKGFKISQGKLSECEFNSCPTMLYRIVKGKWTNQKQIAFLAGIKMTGIDEVGLVNRISKVISSDLKVNMRSISIDSNDGIFEGTIMLFVNDTHHLDKLIQKLKEINGILTVSRIDGK